MYGPATFYFNAGVMAIFGEFALAVKGISLLVKLGLVYIALVFIRQYQPLSVQVLGGLTSAGLLIGFGFDLFPVFHAILLILLAFWFLTHSSNVLVGGFLSGAGLALAALFRHDLAGYALFCSLVYFLVRIIFRSPRFKSGPLLALTFLSMGIACSAIFILPTLALIYAAGIENLYHDLLHFPGTVYPEVRSLPWPVAPLQSLIVYLPFLAPLVFLAYAVRRPSSELTEVDRNGLLILVMLASVIFILKGSVRTSAVHMAPAIFFFNILVFSCLPRLSCSRVITGQTVFFGLIVGFLIAWGAWFAIRPSAMSTLHFIKNQTSKTLQNCREPIHPKLACMTIPNRYGAALTYLTPSLSEGDSIYVGVSDHSRIFVNFQAFYFLSGSFAPTRWEELHPGLQNRLDIQSQIVASFSATPPKFVLLDAAWIDVSEPNASSVDNGVELLDAFIADNYIITETYGSLALMTLK